MRLFLCDFQTLCSTWHCPQSLNAHFGWLDNYRRWACKWDKWLGRRNTSHHIGTLPKVGLPDDILGSRQSWPVLISHPSQWSHALSFGAANTEAPRIPLALRVRETHKGGGSPLFSSFQNHWDCSWCIDRATNLKLAARRILEKRQPSAVPLFRKAFLYTL